MGPLFLLLPSSLESDQTFEKLLLEIVQVITNTKKTRRVDLSTVLVEELRALWTRRRAQYLKDGKNEIPDWVFCNRVGHRMHGANVRTRIFYLTLNKAGLRHVRFHDLRHTFATLLIQNGEPIAYVQKQLGHSSIQMSVDTYTHWMPGDNREAMDRLPQPEVPEAPAAGLVDPTPAVPSLVR